MPSGRSGLGVRRLFSHCPFPVAQGWLCNSLLTFLLAELWRRNSLAKSRSLWQTSSYQTDLGAVADGKPPSLAGSALEADYVRIVLSQSCQTDSIGGDWIRFPVATRTGAQPIWGMTEVSAMSAVRIQVAGDVCIDVIGVRHPRPAIETNPHTENWRLTGETRTHYLRGGALLLADFVAAACGKAEVEGQTLLTPNELSCGGNFGPLDPALLMRLTRNDIVHSVIRAVGFKTSPKADKKDKTLRVDLTEGFTGPQEGLPTLKVAPPQSSAASLLVLDDTGNFFRTSKDQWPAAIAQAPAGAAPIVVHKLHRPLPAPDKPETMGLEATCKPLLWETLARNFPRRRVVVVPIDDLRSDDVSISRGLSWERTALDLVWNLMNLPQWEELRTSPHLIVRLGLDGAVYWHYDETKANDPETSPYQAWLIYDPDGIEGSWEASFAGRMVAYGSAFVAGLTKHLAANADPLMCAGDNGKAIHPLPAIEAGIRCGLSASRLLLKLGYGKDKGADNIDLCYPGNELFDPEGAKDHYFACQPIPLIPEAAVPDRAYWRLIDTIFAGKAGQMRAAALLLARSRDIVALATGKENSPDRVRDAAQSLRQVPIAVFAEALRAYDRHEIESYRALYSLVSDYMSMRSASRPLSLAVFGPPGAGKSFGVKKVARALANSGAGEIEELTFNLSQYKEPEELAAAFHLVRDAVLRGKFPLVFFDEFDTAFNGQALGWLRYFLSPMQDGEFLDRGSPHPIGKSIFVFAGGTRDNYADFAAPLFLRGTEENEEKYNKFKDAKGPDFLSRLRGTLDIPGLDLEPEFEPFGPTEAYPCEASILLRRANILAYQLHEKAASLEDANKVLDVSEPVLRALLYLPRFVHGNRSFEALLDMSHLVDARKFTPSLLPASQHAALHADATQMMQLLTTGYPYSDEERDEIAMEIHKDYLEKNGGVDPTNEDRARRPWESLPEDLKDSNRQQADHIAVKLRSAGLWFRKRIKKDGQVATNTDAGARKALELNPALKAQWERLAEVEHDRWIAEKRRAGWIPAADMEESSRSNRLLVHNCLFPWNQLTDPIKKKDLDAISGIPRYLAAANFEIYAPIDHETRLHPANRTA